MNFHFVPASSLFFVASLFALLISVYSLRRRNVQAANALTIMMFTAFIWTLGSGLGYAATTIPLKSFFGAIEYAGGFCTLAMTLVFILQITDLRHPFMDLFVYAVFGISGVIVALAFTNSFHNLVWVDIILMPDNQAEFVHGPAYFVANVVIYLVTLVIWGLLIWSHLRGSRIERRQSRLLILAVSIPAFSNFLYNLGVPYYEYTDFTPASFSLTGLVLLYALHGRQLLDIIPLARNTLVEWMSDGVLVLDAHDRILDINNSLQINFGMPLDGLGKSLKKAIPHWPTLLDFALNDEERSMELVMEGQVLRVYDIRKTFLTNWRGKQSGRVIIFRDITRRYRAEQALQQRLDEITLLKDELQFQAQHDPLTQAFNRRYMEEHLPHLLANARKAGTTLAVLMLDIDKFKGINDTYGHASGDHVLVHAVRFFQDLISDEGLVCRYGGEEFVLIQPMGEAPALQLAESIRVGFPQHARLREAKQLDASISIGVAIYPDHGHDRDSILDAADAAMYQAKWAGGNRVALVETAAKAL
jgi:diguanylate cyclase (GGDEF)-like protein